MGAISSCCSAESAENKEAITLDGSPNKGGDAFRHGAGTGGAGGGGADGTQADTSANLPRPPAATSTKTIPETELNAFQQRLEHSMEVIVLLADGTRLTCDLKLNAGGKTLVISCDTNVREIPLTELKAILHGRDQLRRVETKANLTDDPNCIALHMQTGNCIPIRFETQGDKNAFIELVKKLK